MNKKLASDFLRLLIVESTKEDKLEAYHRVLDLAFKIINLDVNFFQAKFYS